MSQVKSALVESFLTLIGWYWAPKMMIATETRAMIAGQ